MLVLAPDADSGGNLLNVEERNCRAGYCRRMDLPPLNPLPVTRQTIVSSTWISCFWSGGNEGVPDLQQPPELPLAPFLYQGNQTGSAERAGPAIPLDVIATEDRADRRLPVHVRDLFDLTKRTALVTGGAGIYGRPICEALAEAGAHVLIASRNRAQCQFQAGALVQRGLRASADHYDQGSETSILELRDRTLQQFGCIDILVNNSVSRPMRSYQDPLEAWRQSMEVNVTGLFAVSRAFLDPMMERGRGTIINVGSIQSGIGNLLLNAGHHSDLHQTK